MELKHRADSTKGAFFFIDNGKEVATMTYVFAGETRFIIDHTVVDPGYEGKGLGKQLVKAAVDFAREHKYKILPLCPYAKKVFERTPEYTDVL